MQRINTNNWTHTRYTQGNFMALISFGASPEGIEKDEMEYYVTVLEDETYEKYQETFKSLPEACFFINNKYQDWNFVDELGPKSGCSTCAAH